MATNNSVNTSLSAQTGTGKFVGDTSPTLVTPVLGAATVISINFGGSTLSTYAENTAWTPVVTFGTPGDLSVSYSTQTGKYTRIGNIVIITFTLTFTPTFTTASGNLNITGLPFASGASCIGSIQYQTSTFPAGTTSLDLRVSSGASLFLIGVNGSGVASNFMSATQVTSGVAVSTIGTITYLV